MFLISPCSCLWAIYWSQVLSRDKNVVRAASTGDGPTTSERSTILLSYIRGLRVCAFPPVMKYLAMVRIGVRGRCTGKSIMGLHLHASGITLTCMGLYKHLEIKIHNCAINQFPPFVHQCRTIAVWYILPERSNSLQVTTLSHQTKLGTGKDLELPITFLHWRI